MLNIEKILKQAVSQAIEILYGVPFTTANVRVDNTGKEFEGDYTVLCFPFARLTGKKPQDVAEDLGQYLSQNHHMVHSYNVANGFCNLTIDDAYWTTFLSEVLADDNFGQLADKNQTVVVEYSSPNTNKPLHLGHIRNNLLGYATSEILKAVGYRVKKVQVINDRGIHICKSMLAWQMFGNGETPKSADLKGDHLVGKYYVQFEAAFQKEYAEWKKTDLAKVIFDKWIAEEKNRKKADKMLAKQRKKATEVANRTTKSAKQGLQDAKVNRAEETLEAKHHHENYFFKTVYKNTYFNEHSNIGGAAKVMLKKWENGDEAVTRLWETMNSWVYSGFEATYQRLGVDFDKLYYESDTYLLGKEVVEEGLRGAEPIFYKQEDGSTWIDLADARLGKKVVLRKDGTSMYVTQDIGTAKLRYQDFEMDKMVYVVGNEQEYHFKVLFEILHRLGYRFAKKCYHLSYGMVNLTTGKMKSREGTVVDADDLMQSLFETVKAESKGHRESTLEQVDSATQQTIWQQIALAALKFYILKVEPHKSMTFDPKQSIDLQGQTGPYIQNAFVRTQAVQRKLAKAQVNLAAYDSYKLEACEKGILRLIYTYPSILEAAAKHYNPAELANYLYALAKAYHKFWNEVTILDKSNPAGAKFRVDLSKAVARTLAKAGALLGISMPQRM